MTTTAIRRIIPMTHREFMQRALRSPQTALQKQPVAAMIRPERDLYAPFLNWADGRWLLRDDMLRRPSLLYGGTGGKTIRMFNDNVTGTLDKDLSATFASITRVVPVMTADASLTNGITATAEITGGAGHVLLKVWKPTGAGDVTPIASAAAVRVDYIVEGVLASGLDVGDPSADWGLSGTNAVDTVAAVDATGGIKLTTTTGANDQVLLSPRSASPWNSGVLTDKDPIWGAVVCPRNVDANTLWWAGLKLTNVSVQDTDADGVFFRTDGTGQLEVLLSVNNVNTDPIDTGVTPAADTDLDLRIIIGSDRVVTCWVNGWAIELETAIKTGITLKPFVGLQTLTTAAKALTIRKTLMGARYAA